MLSSSAHSAFTKIGQKGSDVYTADGVGDPRVTLNTLLVRGVSEHVIREQMSSIWEMAQTDRSAMEDLWVLLFQNRDIRGGKGERSSTELMWKFLCEVDPAFVRYMLSLVPEYGCWRDLFMLPAATGAGWVRDAVLQMAVTQLRKDHQLVLKASSDYKPTVSLVAKWIPREDRQPHLAKELAKMMFPMIPHIGTRLKLYRKMVSAVNAYLKTVEINMCAKAFGTIEPKAVPGRALKKYTKAFLNEVAPTRKNQRLAEGQLRYPEDPDRMACRQNFQDFFQAAAEGRVVAKAKDVVFPHELIRKIAASQSMSTDESNAVIAQWKALVKAAQDAGGLGRSLAMCDFSGSMQSSGTNGASPYWVSMAMGLLISEITTPGFKDSFITFDSNPILHRMNPASNIIQRVHDVEQSGIGQGLSTDFQKAMDLVLSNIKANRIRPGQEPDNLIVITDMNWDAACGSDGQSVYTGHAYRNVVKTNPWQTHIQMIREAFKRLGEDMWGVPFVPPRIVIWNVAATSDDFHAQKDTEGVVMVSGWSPSLFKNLLKGEIRSTTPMEMLRIILDDERYDPVRSKVTEFLLSTRG